MTEVIPDLLERETGSKQVLGAGVPQTAPRPNPQDVLPPPVILEHEALLAGNPLATYAAMCEKEDAYRKSPFAPIYRLITACQDKGFRKFALKAMNSAS